MFVNNKRDFAAETSHKDPFSHRGSALPDLLQGGCIISFFVI